MLSYLQAKAKQGHSCFEVLTFNGTHGEVFLHPKWVKLLVDKVRLQCCLPLMDYSDKSGSTTPRNSSSSNDLLDIKASTNSKSATNNNKMKFN